MAKNIYALLVGIDEYDPASIPLIPTLKGSVNDIKAVAAFLRERIAKDIGWQLIEPTNQPWILTNQQATRQAIINGFQQHLCNADSDDVVLFYYAGHGAEERAPEEFWHLEPDRLNKTLVCYDSRTEDSRDLADKELTYLISKVAQKHPHILTILDCCHSGLGTSDLSPEKTVRRSPIDWRERPLNSFIFADDQTALDELLTANRDQKQQTQSQHIIFSACKNYELAKEYRTEDGQFRGAFSDFLLQTLERTNGSITYQDLARNIHTLVNSKLKDQSPQVTASDIAALAKPFLGGAISKSPEYFTLNYSQNDQSWVIDGGSLHGLPQPGNGGDTLLAFFAVGTTSEQLQQLSAAVGEAQVKQVLSQKSLVEIINAGESLSVTETYWAVVTNLPLPSLKVYIKGDATGVKLAQQALHTPVSSLFVSQIDQAFVADCHLLAHNGQYWITQPASARSLPGGRSPSLVDPIPEYPNPVGYTIENAILVIRRLEHIARWHNIIQFSNPVTSHIQPNDLEMEIVILSGNLETASSEVRVEYTDENDVWQFPIIQIKLTNHSHQTLYCNVLDLSESYTVDVPFFEQKSSIRLAAKETITSFDNIGFIVPDIYWQLGRTEYKDVFKLIVSTREFDASLLEQDGINSPSVTRFLGEKLGTLDRLMQAVNTCESVRASGNYDHWLTKQVTITIVRPQASQSIQSEHSTLLQNGVVEVQPHPSLQAKVNLTSVSQASKYLGNLILPAILRQQPSVNEFWQFTPSRGSDPGLSALELSDVEDYTVITPETPLKFLVNTALTDNEYLLPFAYDGEFFLPLGSGKRTEKAKIELAIERLPRPIVSNHSLQGSIWIFLVKIANLKRGLPFEYPILAVANLGENDAITYEKNQEKVKSQVAEARRIILLIHGLIGDTASMIPSVNQAIIEVNGELLPIKQIYDLVLIFDYESTQTTIEENARLLGQRLHAVGLGATHGKELHIVAHSLGGLVSRWFIEQEGGNQVVQHLVMLGTPNAGFSWPVVQDWVLTSLGIGLNQLSAMAWNQKVLADLLEFLEAKDYSLEQMQPDSDLIKAIANHNDPQTPYTIIAGNKSLVRAAVEIQPAWQSSLIQRLVQRLLGKAVDLTVFQQPNDMAVTLASIKSVSNDRTPRPKILLPDAACDHFTYFTHQLGLAALAKAIQPLVHPPLNLTQEALPSPWDISLPIQAPDAIPYSQRTPSATANQQGENASGVNDVVIKVIALLIIVVVGLMVWKRSPQPQPENPNKTSQPIPGS
ncbi:alpha/beta hydrolase family protein,Caspase domain-containing protein [Cylindrospermum stagnale PCC 7417]|uniref:Alpha/beta hydrolase family protein,Caspase domain-containing protein n=1 Tax=Cylindrospermum stagnale PCC 7417 TaxID=56107 RepID=K9WWZ7_9NOST|nr:caspase family protein [Cylindrospermum stagnale]AFZ24339.1 alpha/beta hydrolase family protein,Caspase domain-containing protein [Cylindrospermum stagnale PCC 7417]